MGRLDKEKDFAMPTYTLAYEDDGRGVERKIEFDAADPSRALMIAQTLKPGRSAMLWQENKPLCRLERRLVGSSCDVWVVAGAGAAAEMHSNQTEPGGAS